MRYRNVKTGDVIDSPCVISGSNWEPVEEDAAVFPDDDAAVAEVSEEKPPRPAGVRNNGSRICHSG